MKASATRVRTAALPSSMGDRQAAIRVPGGDPGARRAHVRVRVVRRPRPIFREPLRRLFTCPRSTPHDPGCSRGGPVREKKAVQAACTLASSPRSESAVTQRPVMGSSSSASTVGSALEIEVGDVGTPPQAAASVATATTRLCLSKFISKAASNAEVCSRLVALAAHDLGQEIFSPQG